MSWPPSNAASSRAVSSPSSNAASSRLDLVIVLLLLAWAVRVFWLGIASPPPGIDYYQFWLVGEAGSKVEITNIYSPEGRESLAQFGRELLAADPSSKRLAAAVGYRRTIETFSTPFLYLALRSVSTGNYDVDLDLFHAFSLACFAFAIMRLCRSCGYGWRTTCLVLLALLTCSDPLASDTRVANVNQIQLAGIAAYLWLLDDRSPVLRQAVAGLLLAVLILFKPTLGLVFVFLAMGWVADRRWRTLSIQSIAIGIGSTLAVVSSSIFLGSTRAWLDWMAALPDLESAADVSVRIGNFCISRIATELGAPEVSMPLLAATVLGTAWVVWSGIRRFGTLQGPQRSAYEDGRAEQQRERDYLMLALACAASVVALRLVWVHYYLLVLPLAIYLLRPRLEQVASVRGTWRSPVEAAAVSIAILGVLGGPLRIVMPRSGPYAAALPYVTGAVLLFLFGLIELHRLGAPRKSSTNPSSRRSASR